MVRPVAVGVVAVYSWWATAVPPFSALGTVTVLAAGAAAMLAGTKRRRPAGAGPASERPHPSWALLFAAICVWELIAYLQHPRDEHPTLSHLANLALTSHTARATAFAAWVAGAFALARR